MKWLRLILRTATAGAGALAGNDLAHGTPGFGVAAAAVIAAIVAIAKVVEVFAPDGTPTDTIAREIMAAATAGAAGAAAGVGVAFSG